MKDSVIEISGLNFSVRNKNILNDIDLVIERGTFYAAVGPNGSGKTTFLKALSKVLTIGRKTVFIDSQDISSISERNLAGRMASVPQNIYAENDFSAFEIVLMGRAPHKKLFETESHTDLRLVREAMELTNTWHLKDIPSSCLSGGEKQRVVIARALAQETEILLLDEPVSNLDIHHQIDILNLISSLHRQRKMTIIAVLHDLNHVLAHSQKVLLFNNGNLVAHGNTYDVLTRERIRECFAVDAHFMVNPLNGKNIIVTA
jgi:iron complex transport system ATP-binding protein